MSDETRELIIIGGAPEGVYRRALALARNLTALSDRGLCLGRPADDHEATSKNYQGIPEGILGTQMVPGLPAPGPSASARTFVTEKSRASTSTSNPFRVYIGEDRVPLRGGHRATGRAQAAGVLRVRADACRASVVSYCAGLRTRHSPRPRGHSWSAAATRRWRRCDS